VGDVILVDSADSLVEEFNPERFGKVINCQVITESGNQLGRVLGFSFDIETGELTTLVVGALGVPLLGEGVLSTWELPVQEVVSSGADRIIVYEGAEDKLKQLGTGLLEKLGIGGSSWEQEERERFRMGAVPAENQLPAGQPTAQEQRRIQPATSRAFQPAEELEYVELEDRREREPLRQRRYLDDDPEPAGRYRPSERSERAGPGREPYQDEEAYRDQRFNDERPYRDDPRAYGRQDRQQGDPSAGDRYESQPYGSERPGPDPYPEDPYEEVPSARPSRPSPRSERRSPPRPEREPNLVDVEPEVIDDPW
jgi:sporulation protein YlmC with PRC-barrel domain